jgi:hypothetical protein
MNATSQVPEERDTKKRQAFDFLKSITRGAAIGYAVGTAYDNRHYIEWLAKAYMGRLSKQDYRSMMYFLNTSQDRE